MQLKFAEVGLKSMALKSASSIFKFDFLFYRKLGIILLLNYTNYAATDRFSRIKGFRRGDE